MRLLELFRILEHEEVPRTFWFNAETSKVRACPNGVSHTDVVLTSPMRFGINGPTNGVDVRNLAKKHHWVRCAVLGRSEITMDANTIVDARSAAAWIDQRLPITDLHIEVEIPYRNIGYFPLRQDEIKPFLRYGTLPRRVFESILEFIPDPSAVNRSQGDFFWITDEGEVAQVGFSEHGQFARKNFPDSRDEHAATGQAWAHGWIRVGINRHGFEADWLKAGKPATPAWHGLLDLIRRYKPSKFWLNGTAFNSPMEANLFIRTLMKPAATNYNYSRGSQMAMREGVLRVEVNSVEHPHAEVIVISNPTPSQLKNLIFKANYGLRGIAAQDGKLFVWDAALATHHDIEKRLGFPVKGNISIFIDTGGVLLSAEMRNSSEFDDDSALDEVESFLHNHRGLNFAYKNNPPLRLMETQIREAQFRQPIVMFHGTSSNFLRTILKQGIVPDPKKKSWDVDPNASEISPSRVSLPGSYWTSNIMTAVSSAFRTMRKFGGTSLLVIAKINEQSAFADEDSIGTKLNYAWGETIHDLYEGKIVSDAYSMFLLSYLLPFKPYNRGDKDTSKPVWIETFGKNLYKHLGATDYQRIEPALVQRVLEAYLMRPLSHIWANEHRPGSGYFKTLTKYVDDYLIPAGINITIPTPEEAETEMLKVREILTRKFRRTVYKSEDSFNHSLRLETPVGFSGANHIIAIVEDPPVTATSTSLVNNDDSKILRYGQLPSEYFEQYRKREGRFPGAVDTKGRMVVQPDPKKVR